MKTGDGQRKPTKPKAGSLKSSIELISPQPGQQKKRGQKYLVPEMKERTSLQILCTMKV